MTSRRSQNIHTPPSHKFGMVTKGPTINDYFFPVKAFLNFFPGGGPSNFFLNFLHPPIINGHRLTDNDSSLIPIWPNFLFRVYPVRNYDVLDQMAFFMSPLFLTHYLSKFHIWIAGYDRVSSRH